MSYDLEIRSDDESSQSVPYGPLRAFINELPKVAGSTFRDEERDLFMNIDLEFLAPEKGATVKGEVGRVNMVSLHIPYSKLHDDERDDEYFDLAAKIAKHLGWKVWDCQQDEYIA